MKPGSSSTEPSYSYIWKAMKNVVITCVLVLVVAYYRGLSVTNVLLLVIALVLGMLALQITMATAVLGGKDGLDLRRLLNKVEDIRRMIAERNELDGIEDRMDAQRDDDIRRAAEGGYTDAYLDNLKALEQAREASEGE